MDYIETNSTAENMTDLYDYSASYLPEWAVVLGLVILCLIDIVGIIGNCMIIMAVAFSKKLQTSTNAFVTSLAITDLLTCLAVTLGFVSILPLTPEVIKVCQFVGFVNYSSIGTSLYTLGAIGINRLLLIIKPILHRRIFTSWKLGILVAIPWIIPSGSFLIALLNGVGAVGFDPVDSVCGKVNNHERAADLDLILFVVGFPIPFIVIIVSYTWIYVYIKKHFKTQKNNVLPLTATHPIDNANTSVSTLSTNTTGLIDSSISESMQQQESLPYEHRSDNDPSPTNVAMSDFTRQANANTTNRIQKISQQEVKITKNLFLVVCTFFICFVPLAFVVLVGKPSPTVNDVAWYLQLLGFANSAINFFIYASKHPDFKIVLSHMMRCSYSKIPHPSGLLMLLLSKKN